MAMGATGAIAATPTSKPSAKPSVKATTKAQSTKKPVAKKYVAKKMNAKVTPSPAPSWPPSKKEKWTLETNLYFRIPSKKEQSGVLSNKYEKTYFSDAMKNLTCNRFACGVIQVISATGCNWWEIDATVSRATSPTDKTKIIMGTLRTLFGPTKPQQRVTAWMVSTEPLQLGTTTTLQDIYCYHSVSIEKLPSNTYTAITASPSSSPTNS